MKICSRTSCGHLIKFHKPSCTWPGCTCLKRAITITIRELQVLHLIAAGKYIKEIGGILNISPKTVGVHLNNMAIKCGTHSQIQLVLVALRNGLLSLDELPIIDTEVFPAIEECGSSTILRNSNEPVKSVPDIQSTPAAHNAT